MKKLLLAAPSLLLLLIAGCAHGNAGYAAAGYPLGECDFAEGCYGYDRYAYTCVFYQAVPAVPARSQVVLGPRHSSPRVVHRGDGDSIGRTDPGMGSSSANLAPSASAPAPAPVAREPVTLTSPSVDRSPRTRN